MVQPMPSLSRTCRNEKRKITATALNNIAVSFIVTGVVVPVVSAAYRVSIPKTSLWWLFAVVWVATGLGFHVASRRMLEGIEE